MTCFSLPSLCVPVTTTTKRKRQRRSKKKGIKSMDWFEQTFGFREQRYENVRKQFVLEENDTVLASLRNGRRFHIGSFTTPSLQVLNERLNYLVQQSLQEEADTDSPDANNNNTTNTNNDTTNNDNNNTTNNNNNNNNTSSIGLNCYGEEIGLKFQHLIEDVKKLHADPKNKGAVFQVASQFNCLEMPTSQISPDRGITNYKYDTTQGPVCAISCSPATVYRNYFLNTYGQGGKKGKQIDCLDDMGFELGNVDEKYWIMRNGYALPSKLDSMKILKTEIYCGGTMARNAMYKLKVGVQWDTEVVQLDDNMNANTNHQPNANGNSNATATANATQDSHRVTQVFCSALPISYATTRTKDFEPFARLVLDSTYQSTFAIAAIRALETNQRVNLYLTKIGGGSFGNRSQWIVDAIRKAIKKYEKFPLDVYLIHYGSLEQAYLQGLQGSKQLSLITDYIESNIDKKKLSPVTASFSMEYLTPPLLGGGTNNGENDDDEYEYDDNDNDTIYHSVNEPLMSSDTFETTNSQQIKENEEKEIWKRNKEMETK